MRQSEANPAAGAARSARPPGRAAAWRVIVIALAPLAGTALLAGCVLRNTSEPPRYFTPTVDGAALDPPATPPIASAAAIALRLARVRAPSYIGERIVWRSSDVERGLYEQRRWTEPPADLFESALARSLFQGGALQRSDSGAVASLEVKLLAFDEVLAPRHEAEIRASVLLVDAKRVPLLDRDFVADSPIASDQASAVAHAMGAAMETITGEIADAVRVSLVAAVPPSSPKERSSRKSR